MRERKCVSYLYYLVRQSYPCNSNAVKLFKSLNLYIIKWNEMFDLRIKLPNISWDSKWDILLYFDAMLHSYIWYLNNLFILNYSFPFNFKSIPPFLFAIFLKKLKTNYFPPFLKLKRKIIRISFQPILLKIIQILLTFNCYHNSKQTNKNVHSFFWCFSSNFNCRCRRSK